MAKTRLPIPKIGDFVGIWLFDHAEADDPVACFASGVVIKINKRSILVDHWFSRGDTLELEASEWKSSIDRRCIESITINKVPAPPEL